MSHSVKPSSESGFQITENRKTLAQKPVNRRR